VKPKPPNNNLLADLAKRGVYQAVGIYVAVAWGIIEILITVADRFGWPAWLGDAALILFLTGLPFVVLLSWAFDLTGHGLQRVEPGSLRGKTLIAGGLTLVLGVTAFLFVLREEPRPAYSPATRVPEGKPVIAVLPFQDFVGEGNSAVQALAFTDEVINRINAHPDLIALDLNSVSNPVFGGLIAQASADAIAFDYVVRGSLRPAPVGVELRVRMTDPQGVIAWENSTVRDIEDPVEARNAQQFVAAEVAAGVGRSLTGIDYCEPSANAEATRLYYEARDHFARRGPHVATAARLLEQAIELDSQFARAMDLLAAVYQRFPVHVSGDPGAYGMSEAELVNFMRSQPEVAVARKALDLCPTLGESYVVVELSAPVHHTFADAVEIFVEGFRRDHGAIQLIDRVSNFFFSMGHLETAAEYANEVYRRDPLNARALANLSGIELMRGKVNVSLELLQQALDAGLNPANAHMDLAYLLYLKGDRKALNELLEPEFPRIAGAPSQSHWPFDPRELLAAQEDAALHQRLTADLERLAMEGDPMLLALLIGMNGAPPWLFELGDHALAWRALQRLAEHAPLGATPEGIWYHRWRHWFGSTRLLELGTWTPLYTDFWDRLGPPDGCTWDGAILDCDWAEDTPAAMGDVGPDRG
jgi:TolB-like protein